MTTHYRAVQATAPSKLQLTELPLKDPPAGEVRIRVEACGVCHSDVVAIEGGALPVEYPRVPGHELVVRRPCRGEAPRALLDVHRESAEPA